MRTYRKIDIGNGYSRPLDWKVQYFLSVGMQFSVHAATKKKQPNLLGAEQKPAVDVEEFLELN